MNPTASTSNSRSLVLVDTSVLLIDPDVLVRVVGNNGIPFITKTVLDEIDFNKKNQDQSVSHNARYILRELSELPSSEMSALPGGKPICTGDTVRQFTFLGKSIFVLARDQFRERGNDAKIIEVAKDYGMIVITRDAGFKVRAETEGLESHLWSEKNRPQATPQQTVQQPSPTGQGILPFGLPGTPVSVRDVQLPVSMIPVSGQSVTTRDHGTVRLTSVLSSGGEGTIFETDLRGMVCKVYRSDRLTAHRQQKVELMLSRKIDRPGICWPVDVALNQKNEFVGYLMPKAKGKPVQTSMFVKPVLEKSFPNWKRRDLVNLCGAFLDHVAYLHNLNILIGDINPLNLLVDTNSNQLSIVDTDSFQIEGFPCAVGTVNFTAPEIQGKNYEEFLRTKLHELFAVATMLFMILHPGKPPYAQQGGGNPADNIRAMDFPYGFGGESSGKAPEGPWQRIWSNLPFKLKEAFSKTFKKNERIEVAEWRELIKAYLWGIDKGYNSNDLFPLTFKIRDPITVPCGKCGTQFTQSKEFVDKLASQGKPCYCGTCYSNTKLEILARKSKVANQQINGGSTEKPKGTNTSFGGGWSPPPSSSRPPPGRRPASASSRPSSNTGPGWSRNTGRSQPQSGGLLSWILKLFK